MLHGSTIKLGDITYTVNTQNDDILSAKDCWGEIDYFTQVIYVHSKIAQQKQFKVFIREIIHGLLHEAGPDKYAHDEDFVRLLTPVLNQFLTDNLYTINRMIGMDE